MNKVGIILLFFLLGACKDSGNLHITEFDDSELAHAVLLDVRTPEENDLGHLEGAMNIDWLAEDFTKKVDTIARSKTVYLYCKAGGRSAKAAGVMRVMGFKNVVNLEGGYDALNLEAE